MKLDFSILWVEDQPESVRSFQESLERDLRELGFALRVIAIRGFDELKERMSEELDDDEIDLILVDFDLGNTGGNGGDAAREIRDHFQHREMVFYSGKSPGGLRQVAADKKIDGAYFAHRPTLDEDVFSVIENMLRKIIDISHMRGIVMAETSELDYYIELCLAKAFEKLDQKGQETFHSRAVEVIQQRYQGQIGQLEDLGNHKHFMQLLGQSLLMTSKDRTRALRRFLKSASDIENRKQHRSSVLEYQDNFHHIRDVLAHGMVIKKDGQKIFRGREEELNDEAMRKWRIDLMDHRDRIKQIVDDFNVDLDEG